MLNSEPDNITPEELTLLEGCLHPSAWDAACDRIKAARDGQYPPDWWAKVKLTGMMDRIFSRWGEKPEIHIRSGRI